MYGNLSDAFLVLLLPSENFPQSEKSGIALSSSLSEKYQKVFTRIAHLCQETMRREGFSVSLH